LSRIPEPSRFKYTGVPYNRQVRNNARRMSLLKFPSASQRNATPAAGQSIDRGSPPAAKGTHWIFWSRECPGAAAPGRAPVRTHAADNIQLPDGPHRRDRG
jgi:hypothetical protein